MDVLVLQYSAEFRVAEGTIAENDATLLVLCESCQQLNG